MVEVPKYIYIYIYKMIFNNAIIEIMFKCNLNSK